MRRALIGAALALAWPALAPGAADERPWRAGVHPGGAFPVGEAARNFKNSFSLQGSVEALLPNLAPLSLGLELGHSNRHASRGFDGLVVRVVQAAPYARAAAWFGDTELYGHFGMGYYHLYGNTHRTRTGAVLRVESTPHFGVNAGGGVTEWYGLYGLGFDLRYHRLFSLREGPDFQYLTPSLRFLWAF